jgi:hypothetical protein
MAYNPFSKYLGKVIGDGQCVEVVKLICGCPQTALWKRGALVKGIPILPGTAIATFDPPSAEFPNGRYGNHTDGRSHAAIYLGQDADGIRVADQWLGQPFHERVIRFRSDPAAKPVNSAQFFYVIE